MCFRDYHPLVGRGGGKPIRATAPRGVRPQTHDEGLVMKTSPSWVQTASQMRPGVWERARSKRAWASAQFTTFHQALM